MGHGEGQRVGCAEQESLNPTAPGLSGSGSQRSQHKSPIAVCGPRTWSLGTSLPHPSLKRGTVSRAGLGDTASLDTPSLSPPWSQGLRTGNSRCPRCFSHLRHIPSTCHQHDPLTHCPHQCFHPMSEAEGPSCHGMLEGLRHLEHEGGGWDGSSACPPPLLHLPRGKGWGGMGWLFEEATLLLSS